MNDKKKKNRLWSGAFNREYTFLVLVHIDESIV